MLFNLPDTCDPDARPVPNCAVSDPLGHCRCARTGLLLDACADLDRRGAHILRDDRTPLHGDQGFRPAHPKIADIAFLAGDSTLLTTERGLRRPIASEPASPLAACSPRDPGPAYNDRAPFRQAAARST